MAQKQLYIINGILWLNENHLEEGLDDTNLRGTTSKYLSNHRNHKYELVDEPERK